MDVLPFVVLVVVALVSKVVGCGLPAAYFLKCRSKGVSRLWYGFTSEAGLIVAGVAISTGLFHRIFIQLLRIIITTVLAPLLLKAYDEVSGDSEVTVKGRMVGMRLIYSLILWF